MQIIQIDRHTPDPTVPTTCMPYTEDIATIRYHSNTFVVGSERNGCKQSRRTSWVRLGRVPVYGSRVTYTANDRNKNRK